MKLLKNNFLIILFIFVISSCIFYSFTDNKIIEAFGYRKAKEGSLLDDLQNEIREKGDNLLTKDEKKSNITLTSSEFVNEKKDDLHDIYKLYKELMYRSITMSEDNPDGLNSLEEVKKKMNEKNHTYSNLASDIMSSMYWATFGAVSMEMLELDNNNINKGKKAFEENKKKLSNFGDKLRNFSF